MIANQNNFVRTMKSNFKIKLIIICVLFIIVNFFYGRFQNGGVSNHTNVRLQTIIQNEIYLQSNPYNGVDTLKFGHKPGVEIVDGVCSKGKTPWSRDWLKLEMVRFLDVYNRRPGNNQLGSPMMHQFAMWAIVRHLRPAHIIESGVWKGLGTWIFRQASPDAQLILLDPKLRKNMLYVDEQPGTLYLTDEKFRDFGNLHRWTDINLDLNRTLAFIDDHNTPYKRIVQAKRAGIKHMIFEDNYWLGFFDCLSLKQGCACLMDKPECKTFKFKDSYGAIKRNFTVKDFELISKTFEGIEIYKEFPMMWDLYKPGLTLVSEGSKNFVYDTKDGSTLLKDLGLKWFPYKSNLDGSYTYGNIAYILLK